ncbi:MAG: DUF4157 domain-containing protein [Thermodesulfobacteriota bacterium]|nr:DUF4157 domain-containing protein [Thermodesulfobacteriota bacterium]
MFTPVSTEYYSNTTNAAHSHHKAEKSNNSNILKNLNIQKKLTVGPPNDEYEQEADRVADQVMPMPDSVSAKQRPWTPPIHHLLQTQLREEEELQSKPLFQRQPIEEEEEPVQMRTGTYLGRTPEVNSNLDAHIHALKGRGQPLSDSTRTFFEPRFGRKFNQVRVHRDTQAARSAHALNARAFTTGHDIVFGAGLYAPETSGGKSLLAHELTHVLQQNPEKDVQEKSGGNKKTSTYVTGLTLQRALKSQDLWLSPDEHIQCDPPEQATPTEDDYRDWVLAVIRLFTAAAQRYSTSPVSASHITLADLFREEWQERSGALGIFAQFVRFLESLLEAMQRAASPEGLLLEISRILTEWQRVYDGARGFITDHLAGDATLSDQLRSSYQTAIEAIHRSVRDLTPRVNINLIAEPPAPGDDFITNATAYANSYFSRPQQEGDVVQTIERIASPTALFDTVERVRPERLIRRVDIFAHGTIDPSNQIRFGPTWHTVANIETAADNRQYESRYIQSTARFDDRSIIEIHACRLGGGTGQRFLEGTGRALGGEHGQSVIGYTERWYPYRFEIFWTHNAGGVQIHNEKVVNTQNDIYGPNALPDRFGQPGDHNGFINRFENYAVQAFDDVVVGSVEVHSFLNDAERAGDPVTRARKIEIMRAMYDQNEAWLLGFLHPAAGVAPGEARAGEASADYTFTSENADWQARVLTVNVNPPAPALVP